MTSPVPENCIRKDIFLYKYSQTFIQGKISAGLDLVLARSHAPKILNLYYVYGSIS